jgi:hypothetical protein
LKVEQTKIDGEKQTAEKYGWYTDAVKTVSEEVEAFQKNYLSAMGSSGLMLPSTYKQFSVTYKSGNRCGWLRQNQFHHAACRERERIQQLPHIRERERDLRKQHNKTEGFEICNSPCI